MRKVLIATVGAVLASFAVTAGTTSASASGAHPRSEALAPVVSVPSTQTPQPLPKTKSSVHAPGGTQQNAPGAEPAAASVACPSGDFCAYREGFFQGDVLIFNTCTEIAMPFYDEGSYINNLSRGRHATWYGVGGGVVYITPAAPSSNQEVGWGPVASVQPCT